MISQQGSFVDIKANRMHLMFFFDYQLVGPIS